MKRLILALMAALLVTAFSTAARAQVKFNPLPVTIALKQLECFAESDEDGSASDELYVLVIAARLPDAAVPQVTVTRYGVWSGVDAGETRRTKPIDGVSRVVVQQASRFAKMRIPFWGLNNGAPAVLSDDVVFVVALMENDDGDTEAKRALAMDAAATSLFTSTGLDRETRILNMISDVRSRLKQPTGFPNFDDTIQIRRLQITNLVEVLKNGRADQGMWMRGDGGRYKLTFEVRR